jgi:glutamate synthase (ferredoxin)
VVETAQAWSTHHFAALIGYGASAVHPYLALESVRAWQGAKRTQTMMADGRMPAVSAVQAQDNFRGAIEAGLLKIMSKMGEQCHAM